MLVSVAMKTKFDWTILAVLPALLFAMLWQFVNDGYLGSDSTGYILTTDRITEMLRNNPLWKWPEILYAQRPYRFSPISALLEPFWSFAARDFAATAALFSVFSLLLLNVGIYFLLRRFFSGLNLFALTLLASLLPTTYVVFLYPFAEVPQAVYLVAVLALLTKSPLSLRRAIVVGVLLGLATCFRPVETVYFLFAALFLYGFWRSWRFSVGDKFLGLSVGIALVIGIIWWLPFTKEFNYWTGRVLLEQDPAFLQKSIFVRFWEILSGQIGGVWPVALLGTLAILLVGWWQEFRAKTVVLADLKKRLTFLLLALLLAFAPLFLFLFQGSEMTRTSNRYLLLPTFFALFAVLSQTPERFFRASWARAIVVFVILLQAWILIVPVAGKQGWLQISYRFWPSKYFELHPQDRRQQIDALYEQATKLAVGNAVKPTILFLNAARETRHGFVDPDHLRLRNLRERALGHVAIWYELRAEDLSSGLPKQFYAGPIHYLLLGPLDLENFANTDSSAGPQEPLAGRVLTAFTEKRLPEIGLSDPQPIDFELGGKPVKYLLFTVVR